MTVPTTLADWLSPNRTALLVYDMQIGIARQVKGSDETVRRIATIVAAARSAGIRVAFCRHLSLPKPWMGLFATRMAMAWQRTDDPQKVHPWFLRGSEAVEIVPELRPQEQDFVFDKLGMSAFEGTPLQLAMRDAGLSSLAICGIATEIGIEPTCRHAADLGIVPIVIEDACGHGDQVAANRTFDALRFLGDTIVTTSSEFVGAISGTR
ncbi:MULTISPECIES: cysteine hydrolase [unclassified Rhizobium]|jgi:nicotinamidase-related amidase|uniref:cysteine hydrolase family protein n=1 Tax=unclassified Rhizobium TaxID=2613769 RepID=UPI000645C291|nr:MULTISPECIES: cysteine hydrolase [unclassified Rhizobium]MBN8952024.1 cysteine hydrolase [Rhizobium tropici]OJY78022.1 MAG: isochorismatase [Rhizobium sp. 60-20]RKD56659.1 nicotinamidase-related amidase [Rhizobium sp. WW_1]